MTRQRYISNICESKGWVHEHWDSISPEMGNIIVDHKHRILYFAIAKCGSISFRTMFGRIATGNATYQIPKSVGQGYFEDTGLFNFRFLSADEKTYVFNNYAKLVFIRHPLDRLRATYDDKLKLNSKQNPKILDINNRKHIDDYFKEKGIKRDNFNPNKEFLTFEQFLDIVGTKYEEGFYNAHWKPIIDRSWACDIRFDFIIRLESIELEQDTLLTYLRLYDNNTSLIQLPHANQHLSKPSDLNLKMQQLSVTYKDIPPAVIQKLQRVYKQDFQVFGYGWDKQRKEAYCSMSLSADTDCC